MSKATSDQAAALLANAEFYAAFSSGDFSAMDALWSTVETVLCVHPGQKPVVGRAAVMNSWRDLFDLGGTPIRFDRDSVVMIRGLAFVSCLEYLGDVLLSATNVFVWEAGAWRLVLHNAGAVADPRAIARDTRRDEILH